MHSVHQFKIAVHTYIGVKSQAFVKQICLSDILQSVKFYFILISLFQIIPYITEPENIVITFCSVSYPLERIVEENPVLFLVPLKRLEQLECLSVNFYNIII